MDRRRSEELARWHRADLAEERLRQTTVPVEERLRETIAWSAALLADELARDGTPPAVPDPVGLGSRRA